MPTRPLLPCLIALAGAVVQVFAQAATAQPLDGTRAVRLHSRDGAVLQLGSMAFSPQPDGRSVFTLALQHGVFKDFFLSMKEFKCLAAATEVFCHLPYPHPQPGTVSATDLAWLEHSLLFMFKTPSDFGAKLWNGVCFQLQASAKGFEGKPQAVDLNRISAPPERPGAPPCRAALRDDIAPAARWFNRLTID